MPKQKTKKSILKRFKVTSTNKIFRGKQNSRHRRAHKSKRRIRTFAKMVQLTDHEAKIVKKLI